MPSCFANPGATSGSSVISATLYGRPSPIGDRLADQRVRGLHLRLDVGRRHVLAGRVDDDLLLAVDDLQVAVLVELADVAGVEPAVVVDRLRGLVGLVAVALHDHGRADQHLAVLRQLDLHARRGRTDGADLDLVRRVRRAGAARLGHAPQLRQRQAERVVELDHLARRGRGAHVQRLDLVEAQPLADLRRARRHRPWRTPRRAPEASPPRPARPRTRL